MGAAVNFYRGCLLGMAVGDALGYTIHNKSWEQICQAYGPNGLLGYDLQEDYAAVTSYTQIAAYLSNGLLLSISRGNRESRIPYVTQGLREWSRSQLFYRDPEQSHCWISKLPAFRRRNCRDVRMLETLRLQSQGFVNMGTASPDSPGALTGAVAIGLFFDPKRMTTQQIGTLAYETVAITHGRGEAALCAAVVAYAIAGLIQEPEVALVDQFRGAIAAMQGQFRSPEADTLAGYLKKTVAMAGEETGDPREGMEKLQCETAAQCLAGAIYASLAAEADFDRAIICSVNHSGQSCATGALVGAFLGAKLGADALPEFYVESLEVVDSLITLADDLRSGTPASGIFDDDWDIKYVQGQPL